MRNYPLLAFCVLAFPFSTATSLSGEIDGPALLNLLVRKGVITAAEAASLRQEAAAAPTTPAPAPERALAAAGQAAEPRIEDSKIAPLSFRIGAADFKPFGFMDLTAVYRNTNAGSAIGTNFAGIPLRNTAAGRLSETKFSAQNSRIGLRIDSAVNDAKVLGYLESDFLGNAPANLGVSSNADTLRMRLYFIDWKLGRWEFLAGQDWSTLTPNRRGVGVLPGDIFYTQNVDTNYQVGLTWARQPQLRAIYRVGGGVTAALALENPDQYAGGANGSAAVTLPSGFNLAQLDTGVATTSPNLHPDVIGKLAYDADVGGRAWHFDLAGLYRSFKVNNFAAGSPRIDQDSTTAGGGIELNAHIAVRQGLTLIGNGYWSRGGGRYLFGQAADVVVLPADAAGAWKLSALRANSYLAGVEWQAGARDLVYATYGRIKIGQRYATQGAGYVGYGYPGAPTSHNRTIDELTFGHTHTMWKSPNYGALQLMTQLSHVERALWYAAPGTPGSAQTNLVFFNVRYVLP